MVGDRGRGARQVLLLERLQGAAVAPDEHALGYEQRNQRSQNERAGQQDEEADPTPYGAPGHDNVIIAAASSHSSGSTASSTRARPIRSRRTEARPRAVVFLSWARSGASRRIALGLRKRAERRQDFADPGRIAVGQTRAAAGDLQRRRDSPGHRLAVAQRPETPGGLEGMAERVAEVEKAARTLVPRVLRDESGLHPRGSGEQVQERRLVARRDRGQRGRGPGGQVTVGDPRRLERLDQAGAIVAVGQRREAGRVDQNRSGRMEGPDEVLAAGMVDPGLAADRGVGHPGRRRRDRVPGHAAQQDRRGEPHDVGDDAAPHREERVVAAQSRGQRGLHDRLDRTQVLAALAV